MLRTVVIAFALLAGCSGSSMRTATMSDLNSTEVTLPNGRKIRCETMRDRDDMMRGMMFRDSLPPDRGMLFIHGSEGRYPYWMFQVRIPLDMIWLDRRRNIVEIVPNVPSCMSRNTSDCPSYGGQQMAMFILELAAGEATKNGLKAGDRLAW